MHTSFFLPKSQHRLFLSSCLFTSHPPLPLRLFILTQSLAFLTSRNANLLGQELESGKSQRATADDGSIQANAHAAGLASRGLGSRGSGSRGRVFGWGVAVDAFEVSDEHALEDFARFVAVADVFESFGCVLAADVEEDFFTAAVGGESVWLAFPVIVCSGLYAWFW